MFSSGRGSIPALVALVALVTLSGCATDPLHQIAADGGFTDIVVQGRPYQHRVLEKAGAGRYLHVYIEGDGRPWLPGFRVSPDPTPRQSLMATLMALDEAPSIYIGRPCYFGVSDPLCVPAVWTGARYSAEVIDSLDAVIDSIATPYTGIVLMGHSGGGSLAMLIAARRSDVAAVITVAGNLDVGEWSIEHGYSPLLASEDPADLAQLPEKVISWHYLGSGDRTVTQPMRRRFFANQAYAREIIVADFNHHCCWQEIWRQILADLAQTLQVITTPSDNQR